MTDDPGADGDATRSGHRNEIAAIDEQILDLVDSRIDVAREATSDGADAGRGQPLQTDAVADRAAEMARERGIDPNLVRVLFRVLEQLTDAGDRG